MLYIFGALAAAVAFIVLMYNGLVSRKNAVKNAWAGIDTQLQRRFDLIPNLMETVKGYMKHERETLESVTKARTAFMGAGSVKEKADAENMMSGALKSLFAVSENYPDLKASQNFMMLQEELAGTENKISYSRQRYNSTVMDYNNTVQKFPTNIIAGMFNYTLEEFFETDSEEARQAVKVQF